MTSNEHLNNIGRFSEYDIQLFNEKVSTLQYNKGETILAEGEVCNSFFYLQSGAAYQYIMLDIDENIIDLHLENEWCVNTQSFITQTKSRTAIKTYTNCVVLKLSVKELHELIAISPAFFQLGKILENGKERAYFFDKSMTPVQKYEHLILSRPALFQTFPLKMISSYLKIAPETLSRVREKLSKGIT
jgi:CRP-like cAMP-binding protein